MDGQFVGRILGITFCFFCGGRRAHSADWSKDIAGGVPRHNGGGHKYTAALETIKVAHSDSDFGATRDDTAAKLG